ncbi:MAG: PEP-CTERM sorting domain-containing protein [Chroococcidiopsidaceae cyanobacterium CP_BM_ER_R8_30]|nr:PEP-CTERM sorting domain-containing protein [Chroococcidiopsidaceae cyanobacterium CP_BM_ER_R8_30]
MTKAAALTASAVAMAVASTTLNPAQAADFDFSWKGDNGYSALGSFSYDEANAPTFISESGAGPTKFLQSFSVSFFDPANNPLESGSSVVNGVSSDRFFRLDFNSQTQNISVLDADVGGTSYQYFLTNLRTPTGDVVPPGVTTFNFFNRATADAALDSSSTVQVTQVPEPSSLLGILALGTGYLLSQRQKLHRKTVCKNSVKQVQS